MALEDDAHQHRKVQPVIVTWIAVAIATLVVILRIITRITLTRKVGSEDYVIIVSLCFSLVLSTMITIEYEQGMGQHMATIPKHNLTILFKAFWASVPSYQIALTATKVSILLQYWRVFVSQGIRRAVIVLGGITVIYGLWSICSTAFMCTPISGFWNLTSPESHCLNKFAVWFANAGLNILTDIAIFVLPMPVLHNLHLPKSQRIALMAVFGLGAFVCLTSILRLKSLWVISKSNDPTWDNGSTAYWSSLECNVGIICASLPTLRKTISRFFPRIFKASSAHGTRTISSRRPSVFPRFPMAQESTRWTDALQVSNAVAGSGRSSARVGLDSKCGTGSVSNDDASSEEQRRLSGSGNGIKVVTVTTQEVEQIERSSREEEEIELARLEPAVLRSPV